MDRCCGHLGVLYVMVMVTVYPMNKSVRLMIVCLVCRVSGGGDGVITDKSFGEGGCTA